MAVHVAAAMTCSSAPTIITCHHTLAVMTTAGLYETSGDWLYDIGLPRQERDQRRHRHRLAGQGRIGNVRAAAGRYRKQRQGAARRQVPLPSTGNGPVCLGTRERIIDLSAGITP